MQQSSAVNALLFMVAAASLLHCCSCVQWPPRITKMPPKELAFVINESLKIECEAEGSPQPEFKWKRNGNNFDWTSNAGRYKKYPGAGTLVIISPQEDDDGQYQCFAENQLGVAVSVITLLRRAELSNFPNSDTNFVTIHRGAGLRISCNAPSSYPEARIIWESYDLNTGATVTVPKSNRIAIDPRTGDLMFANVLETDNNKEYYCTVNNNLIRSAVSGRRNRITLYGQMVQASTRLLSSGMNQINGIANETLDLFCFFSGQPTPQLKWKFKGKEVTSSQEWAKFEMRDSGTVLRLLDLDTSTHAGDYSCSGINEVSGGVPVIISYAVQVDPRPYWINKPTDVSIQDGGSHTFVCRAGDVSSEPKWSVNGIAVNSSSTHIPNGYMFTFTNLTVRDSLVVQCNCSNDRDYVFTNAYLNVMREPPAILLPPVDSKVAATSRLVLNCRTLSAPAAIISWTKNDEPITGGRYELQTNGDLVINKVSITDSGRYSCSAKNIYGQRSASANVIVRQPTIISVAPKDTRIYEGREIKLICTANTDLKEERNLRINWMKDGSMIDFANTPRFAINPQDYSLIISGTKPLDTGIYSCNATNGVDYDVKSAQLIIMGRPEIPTRVQVNCEKLKDQRLAELKWNAGTDNNAPVLKFLVEFSTQYSRETYYAAEINGDGADPVNTQVQVHMRPYISYQFRVKSVNVVGESEPSKPSMTQCQLQPQAPIANPTNLWAEGNRPQNLVVYWTPLSPLDYYGQNVNYQLEVQCLDCAATPNNRPNLTTIINPRQEKVEFTHIYIDNLLYNIETYKQYKLSIVAKNNEGQSSGPRQTVIGYSGEQAPTVAPQSVQLQTVDGAVSSDSLMLMWQMQSNPINDTRVPGYFRGFRIEWCAQSLTDELCNKLKRYQDVIVRPIQGPSMVGVLHSRAKRDTSVSYTGKLIQLPGDTRIKIWLRVLTKYYVGPPSIEFIANTSIGTPGQVTHFRLSMAGVNHLELEWAKPMQTNGPLVGYQLAYQEVDDLTLGFLTLAPVINDPNQLRGAVTGLRPNTNYRVYIYARTESGNGEANFLDLSTIPPNVAPNAPTFAVSQINTFSFNVTFAPSAEGIAGSVFFVQFRIPGRSQWYESQREYRQRWIALFNLTNDQTYEIRVAATNGAAMTTYSGSVLVSTGGSTKPTGLSGASATWFICFVLIFIALVALAAFMLYIRKSRMDKYYKVDDPNKNQPQMPPGGDEFSAIGPPGAVPHTFTGADEKQPLPETNGDGFGDYNADADAAAAAAAHNDGDDADDDDAVEYAPVMKQQQAPAPAGRPVPPPPPPKPRKPRSIEGSLNSLNRMQYSDQDPYPQQQAPPPRPPPAASPAASSVAYQPPSYHQSQYGGGYNISGSSDI